MITEELLKYIENEKKLGKTDDQIRSNLLSQNWTGEDVNEGLNNIRDVVTVKNNITSKVKDSIASISNFMFFVYICISFFIFFIALGFVFESDFFLSISPISIFIPVIFFLYKKLK